MRVLREHCNMAVCCFETLLLAIYAAAVEGVPSLAHTAPQCALSVMCLLNRTIGVCWLFQRFHFAAPMMMCHVIETNERGSRQARHPPRGGATVRHDRVTTPPLRTDIRLLSL